LIFTSSGLTEGVGSEDFFSPKIWSLFATECIIWFESYCWIYVKALWRGKVGSSYTRLFFTKIVGSGISSAFELFRLFYHSQDEISVSCQREKYAEKRPLWPFAIFLPLEFVKIWCQQQSFSSFKNRLDHWLSGLTYYQNVVEMNLREQENSGITFGRILSNSTFCLWQSFVFVWNSWVHIISWILRQTKCAMTFTLSLTSLFSS